MTQSTPTILNELKNILVAEKEALIQNETNRMMEIMKEKEAIIPKLDNVQLLDQDKETVNGIVKELKELQEVNNLLLELSMEYNQTFLDAFQKEAQKKNTYSKEGNFKKTESSGILDQSL